MNNLFVDIEWDVDFNGTEKTDSIIEIGAVGDGTLSDEFQYYLEPNEHVSKKTLSFLKLSRSFLKKNGISKEKAFEELRAKMELYDSIVVWSEDTAKFVKKLCASDESENTPDLCVLQDIVREKCGKRLAFDRVLRLMKVYFVPNELHKSIYDAK